MQDYTLKKRFEQQEDALCCELRRCGVFERKQPHLPGHLTVDLSCGSRYQNFMLVLYFLQPPDAMVFGQLV